MPSYTGPHYVNRKLNFFVKELEKLNVAVAGIQDWTGCLECRWIYFLHSGHTSGDGKPLFRNYGVGIELHQLATDAWT